MRPQPAGYALYIYITAIRFRVGNAESRARNILLHNGLSSDEHWERSLLLYHREDSSSRGGPPPQMGGDSFSHGGLLLEVVGVQGWVAKVMVGVEDGLHLLQHLL